MLFQTRRKTLKIVYSQIQTRPQWMNGTKIGSKSPKIRIFTPRKKTNKHLKMYPLHSPINNGDFPAGHLRFSGAKNGFLQGSDFLIGQGRMESQIRGGCQCRGGTHTQLHQQFHKKSLENGGQNGWWKFLSLKTSKDVLGMSIYLDFFYRDWSYKPPKYDLRSWSSVISPYGCLK